jgi:hypothetical protein
MQRSGYIGDCVARIRLLDFKLLSYIVRRLRDQLLEQVPWDVSTPPKMLGQYGVMLGTFDQMKKA